MSRSQLETVLRVESDREQAASQAFIAAQQQHQAQRQKLQQLQQYRVDYIEQIKRAGSDGLAATRYQQHLSFVAKLDLACEQQLHAISRAKMLADQQKAAWLKQQQRKEAIVKLIDKQRKQQALRLQRQEQQAMDEFANQQFIRRQQRSAGIS